MRREQTLADDLLQRTKESDLPVDALLALLAYTQHEDHDILIEAREEGAEIGSIHRSARRLRERCFEELSR